MLLTVDVVNDGSQIVNSAIDVPLVKVVVVPLGCGLGLGKAEYLSPQCQQCGRRNPQQ